MESNLTTHISLKLKKNPEIIETIESNYWIARRVYQQLYIDIPELFADFIRSMNCFKFHNIDNDIKANGWGRKKLTDVNNAKDFMTIFRTFYQITGWLPLSNGLLIIPDGEAPPGEDRVNMKNLCELFRHRNTHGLVSLPLLGLIQHYLLDVDSFSAWWICESTNQKNPLVIKFVLPPSFFKTQQLNMLWVPSFCQWAMLPRPCPTFFSEALCRSERKKLALSCTGQLQKWVKNVPCQWCLFVRSEFRQRVQRSSL